MMERGADREGALATMGPRHHAMTTWVFMRATQSVRLARMASATPQLLMIGPGCQRQLHVGRSEEDLDRMQLTLERRLQQHGWSYEGCVVD